MGNVEEEVDEEKADKDAAAAKEKGRRYTWGRFDMHLWVKLPGKGSMFNRKPKKEELDVEAKEIEEATGQKYEILKHLGAGSFGTVKLCQHKSAAKKKTKKGADDGVEKFAMKVQW